jgi:putative DNA primase/helicase
MEGINAQAIATALEGKREGDAWRCKCPVHRGRSLIVSDKNGRVLVNCKNGCEQAAIIHELKRLGLWQSTDVQRPRNMEPEDRDTFGVAMSLLRAALRSGKRPLAYLKGRGINYVPPAALSLPSTDSARLLNRRRAAMVFPIQHQGRLVGVHLTWLNGAADQKAKLDNPRRMYGHAKGGYVQLSEIDPTGRLVVGEGTETTLSAMVLAKAAGVAALSAGGLAAVCLPECSEIIIAADNDKPGIKAAGELARRLRYEGKTVRVAIPAKEGWDWNDVVCKSSTPKKDWRRALERVEDGTDEPIAAFDEAAFLNLEFPTRDLLLAPWLPRPGLAMVHAPRGEGKTWFALAVGKAIANGEPLAEWKVQNSGRVLYIDGELPGAYLQERLRKLQASPPGRFNIICRDSFHLHKEMMPDLADEQGREQIDGIIKQCNPDLIILDSLSTLVRQGVENEAQSWAPLQGWLLGHRWQGRTILMIHHSGKSGQQRGTSKREDVLDTVIRLAKRPDLDEADSISTFELHFSKARDFAGKDAAPQVLRLTKQADSMAWTSEPMSSERERRIAEMRAQGIKQKDIAKEMHLTPGRVSQIVKKQQETDDVVIQGPWGKREKDDGGGDR